MWGYSTKTLQGKQQAPICLVLCTKDQKVRLAGFKIASLQSSERIYIFSYAYYLQNLRSFHYALSKINNISVTKCKLQKNIVSMEAFIPFLISVF